MATNPTIKQLEEVAQKMNNRDKLIFHVFTKRCAAIPALNLTPNTLERILNISTEIVDIFLKSRS